MHFRSQAGSFYVCGQMSSPGQHHQGGLSLALAHPDPEPTEAQTATAGAGCGLGLRLLLSPVARPTVRQTDRSRITINTLIAECHTSISVSVGLGEGLRTCILHKCQSAGLGPELCSSLTRGSGHRLVLIGCLCWKGRADGYCKKLFKICFKKEHSLSGGKFKHPFFSPGDTDI